MSNNKLTIKPTDSPREDDPLLEVKDDDGSAQEQEFQPSFRTRRLITIEPCVAFYMMAWWTSSSVLSQYVYQRESDYYNLSSYVEFNSSSGECGVDKNTTHYYYQQKAQQATAQFTLYNDSCASAIEILAVLVYGSLSDQIGRRVPLILSTAGATLKLLLWVAIMRFDLPIFLFIVAGAIESLCGGSTSFLMAVFSFIADISSRKGRAFRITVTEAIFGLSNSVAQVSIGYSIQYLGFTYPTLMLFGLFLFSSLYAIFFVEETRVISRRVSIFAIHQHIMASFRVWTVSDGKGRRSLLLTLLPLFFLSALCLIGLFISRNLFLLDSPFCWGSVFLGVYAAFGLLVTSCGQMITVSFGLRWTNEVVLIAVGTISAASSLILLAFSTKTWMVFLGPVLGFSSRLIIPLLRAMMSKLVHADEQGAMFASVSAIESIASLTGSLTFNPIYGATVFIFRGTVFLVMAGLQIAGFLFMILYGVLKQKYTRHR